jgi:hypothetical protein
MRQAMHPSDLSFLGYAFQLMQAFALGVFGCMAALDIAARRKAASARRQPSPAGRSAEPADRRGATPWIAV